MTTRGRIAITAASALALAVTTFGYEWSAANPDLDSHVWGLAVLGAYGFAILGAFLVGRWWALLPSAAAIAGLWVGSIAAEAERWGADPEALPPAAWIPVVVMAVLASATVVSVGLLARAIWDQSRHSNPSTANHRR